MQQEKGLISSSGIKKPLNNIPLLGKALFWFYCLNLLNVILSMLQWFNSRYQYKMNEIVNKFLLTEDKFISEMFVVHLLKAKNEFKNLSKQKIQLGNKACFQHDITYGRYKDLTKRTESDKVFKDQTFKIVSNPKYNGYKR